MKRFSKILVAVLALCLLVGVLALAISAEDTPAAPAVEGNFVVQGTGYETWDLALAAAANTHTIYLNADWTLNTGLTLEGETTNVKINLNGKTVSVTDGTMLFNVHTNAKLTIEGSGTLNNSGKVLIGGSNYGVVTVNATGSGIVINNNLADTAADVNTFRFENRSTLNVSGKIVVNTNGDTNSRTIFNVADSDANIRTVNLNITDANILYAAPTITGAPAGKVIYTQNSNTTINNSELEGVYSYVIYSANSGSLNIHPYIVDVDASDAVSLKWDSTKLPEIKKAFSITNNDILVANNSKFSATSAENYTSYIDGDLMYCTANKADFTNCEFYGYGRAFYGAAKHSIGYDEQHGANKSQLTFNNCHIRNNGAASRPAYLFCYGPNVRFLGGSINGFGNLANGQPHYIELTDAEGKNTGHWLGVYVDNVLGVSGLKGEDTVISTSWQNAAGYNPASTITGTLPTAVTIVVNGTAKTFSTGYFSDMDIYNSYLPVVEDYVWDDYIYGMSNADSVTATGDFTKVGADAATGTNPFTVLQMGSNVVGINPDKGVVSSVLTPGGNGYVKFYWDGKTYSGTTASSKYVYIQTPTGAAGSIVTNDEIILEFDIATENGAYTKTTLTTQGRGKQPRFDSTGKYLGYSNAGLQINAMDYSPNPNLSFDGTNLFVGAERYTLPTATGEWTRVTVIYDFEMSELKQNVNIPVHAKNGNKNSSGNEIFDLVPDTYVQKNAYQVLKYDMLVYLNGEYLNTIKIDPTTVGIGGYIVEGYEANYYIDGLRIAQTAVENREDSWCFDNVRVSKYPVSANVDLGIYENGTAVESLEGLPHFLIMPTADEYIVPVATVNGVKYATEAEAIAAITEGSTVKLFANFESPINANVSFKLEPNGFTFPGFVSATHKVVDYIGSFGYYSLVPASASEIYTVKYSFAGVDKEQTVAAGTLIPAMNEEFPVTLEGNLATFVSSWTLPVNIPNDYLVAGNVINATPVVETKTVAIMAGGVVYETLAAAVAGANGATIKLYDNVTVNEVVNVAGINATIDLNGKTITASDSATRVFNVTAGGSLTVTGAGTFANVFEVIAASGENTVVNFNADGATSGIVINHRTIEDGANTNTSVTAFYITNKATLNISGLVTVNAYNGRRIVFNVYNGASALNLSRAKVVIPLLSKVPENTTPYGYSWAVSAGDGIAINIEDSEIYMLYGQIFHLQGASSVTNVSAFKNSDYSWKDTAAQGISMGKANMTLVAKNSRFFSEFGSYSQAMHASGHNPGATFIELKGNLNANFENCTITTDWRGVTADGGITGNNIHKHQLTFTDCDFVAAPKTGATANAFPQFFMYGVNFKIIGGTWARGSMSAGSNYYLPLKDASGNLTGEWVGGYMDGVLVDSAKTFLYTGVTSGWSDSTYVEGDVISCNIVRVTDGVARTFKAAYFGNTSEYFEVVKAYEGLAAYYNTGDEATPFNSFPFTAGNGVIDKTLGYVKHSFEGAISNSGYHGWDANNNANWHYGKVGAYIWEFDISTDDGYFATTSFGIEGRYKSANFDATGKYTGFGDTAYEATNSVTISGDTIKFIGGNTKISTEKGVWTTVTVIFDVVLGEVKEIPLEEGSDVTIQVVDPTGTTMSVYVDGVLLDSYNPITTADYFGGCLAVGDAMAGGYIDDLRIRSSASQKSSICYDNLMFMPITHAFTSEDLGLVDADGNVVKDLANSPIHNSIPKAGAPAPVIRVDGVEYFDVETANAAIKEGSIVELLANVDEAIEINYNNIKFVDNGKSFPGFISSAYKFVDWSAARGAAYSAPADASEIVVIGYSYQGIEVTKNAVLGSYLASPAEYGELTAILNKETKSYDYLYGWTLVEGEDVKIVTAAGIAYPVSKSVSAVVVNWTDATGLIILGTDYYLPGSTDTLDAFDGEDIETDHTADYYGYGRIGWNEEQLAAATAGLATSGEYNIAAVMGKTTPDSFPGLQYNLSLYSNFVMNLYVPESIEGVSNLTVSTTPDGSLGITKFASGTLQGVPYEKYGYMLGIADAEIKTFYIVYYVGEERITFPVYVGVPTYAEKVMEIYDADESEKGKATKALIVNMANYASKVLEVNDADMNAEGAAIYTAIINEYDEYLEYYNRLTADRFKADGDLYALHNVGSLNYVTGTGANEGDAEALTYVDSITFNFDTFEPSFIIKLSEEAVIKGLQKPSSTGRTQYYAYGLHAYTGFKTPVYNNMWAEKDGKVYYGSAGIWATMDKDGNITNNGDTSYNYYMAGNNTTWNNLTNPERQPYYNVANVRNDFAIKFYWGPDNSVTETIGNVNYNLAAYINDMIVTGEEANAEYIDAARALYAYSYVAATYKTVK